MPLASGYGYETIRANIVRMMDEGYARNVAIAAAHREAREAYWKRYPDGYLPSYIYPDPKSGRRNPKRYLTRTERSSMRKNPVADLNPADINKGLKLYENFTGRAADQERVIARPKLPDALVCIGDISLIQYVAERDGKTYEFRHPFRASSRPLLCVTPDGKLVLALGGAWTFTKDGFVDH